MARETLPATTGEKITSDISGIPAIDPKRKLPIYPAVVTRGGTPWSFTGLGDSEIYPSPSSNPWASGWMAQRSRLAMLRHSKVASNVNILQNGIVGDGGRCVPCISPYGPDKAEFKKADEIARFCDSVLRHTGNFFSACRQMTDFVHEGNKVAPIDFEDIQQGKYKGKVGLAEIVVWPNDVYTFYRDATGRTQYLKIRNSDPNAVTDIPRRKFWVGTWRPVNNDPNGTIGLIPAWLPFYRDVNSDYEEMAYMAAFSRPSIVIFSAPPPEYGVEETKPLRYADGTAVMEDDPDNPGTLRQRYGYATEQNKLMFVSFEAGSIWSLAGGSKVELMKVNEGGAEVFRNMRDANAREIASAILGTSQLTESTRNLSNSNQNVGEGIAGLNIQEGKKILELSTENDILRELVRWNFGRNAVDYLPIVDFGSGMNGRVPQMFNSIVGFVNGGAFTKDQWWWWCVAQGLPLPYPGEPVVMSVKQDPGGADKSAADKKPAEKSSDD